jgi:uncharacterized protein (TIGR02246 family)
MSALEEIRRVIALYSQLVDDKRMEEWSDLFTEDAVFVAHGNRLEGRHSIAESIGPSLAAVQIKHLVGAPVVDLLSQDRARAWTDLTSFVRGAEGISVVTIGRYYDELRRGDDGSWRLARRELVSVGEPVPEGLTPSPAR